jgi:hypothetical protein
MWVEALSSADNELAALKKLGKVENPQLKWQELVKRNMLEQLSMYEIRHNFWRNWLDKDEEKKS